MEMIEKKVTVTKWISEDGVEFDNELECARHENSELGELMAKLRRRIIAQFDGVGVTCFDDSFPNGYTWYIVLPLTRTDWSLIGQIENLGNCKHVEPGDFRIVFLGIKSSCNTILNVKSFDADTWMRNLSNGKLSVVSLIKGGADETKVAKK